MTNRPWGLVLVAVCLFMVGSRLSGSGDIMITVNPKIKYQTMTGWGAVWQAGEDEPSFPLFADRLFTFAVVDLGINRLTVGLRSGLENRVDYWNLLRLNRITREQFRCYRYFTINDNSDPKTADRTGFQFSELDWRMEKVVLPYKKKLISHGKKLHLNLQYVAFTSQMTEKGCPDGLQYHQNDPEEYAEFIDAAFHHLKSKYGVVPTSLEVILEPNNTSYWKGEEIGHALIAVSKRLNRSGFYPQFIAPSASSMGYALPYMEGISKVEGASALISEFSYHRYGKQFKEYAAGIAERAKRLGVKTSMLEKIGADYHTLHEDLKVGNVSSWLQYTLAYPLLNDDGGKLYIIDTTNPASPGITLSQTARFLRQYFKFIGYGAVRIDATSNESVVDPVAFMNRDGKAVVVVKARNASRFVVQGIPGGKYGIKYTTVKSYDQDLPDVFCVQRCSVRASIPEAGVLTIYGK